ncbi:BLOC-1-related complex subunit 8 isoform X4 [Scyliorhinus torazame]|uniref:BLOC-1-related complex subunit 8 isoform X4 n=1 Tax=Scyliorhinus torazame TaxID=75743 RepID=UPI003B5987D2
MEDQEMHLKVKKVTEKFTESMYFLANEPSLALYRLQEHVRRSLPELVQHKTDMQGVEEQCQGAIYTVEYACSAVKSMSNSGAYFKNIEGLLRRAISIKDQMSSLQSRRAKRAPLPFQAQLIDAPSAVVKRHTNKLIIEAKHFSRGNAALSEVPPVR